jgi:2-C-methyl-D-erythritol 4-phosphate cytidylyltransferase
VNRVPCWGVIPAAGVGSRMGEDVPKQYLKLAGCSVLEHSVNVLLRCDQIMSVVVALHAQDNIARTLPCFGNERVVTVTGGERRCDSVLAALHGLDRVASPGDWVLVHDAARPCASDAEVSKLIAQVMNSGIGAILAEPVVDTVKLADDNARVEKTLDRDRLWRAQTPQMFRFGELQTALADAMARELAVTDEASAMELAGYPVQLVAGSSRNLKITLPADLQLAGYYLHQRSECGQ